MLGIYPKKRHSHIALKSSECHSLTLLTMKFIKHTLGKWLVNKKIARVSKSRLTTKKGFTQPLSNQLAFVVRDLGVICFLKIIFITK